MTKNILKGLLLTLCVTLFAACDSKDDVIDNSQSNNHKFGLAFSASVSAPELGETPRKLMAYDLVGTKKRPEINLLHLKTQNPNAKVPVHLFFKHGVTKKRFYYFVEMEIVDEKNMRLPFTAFNDVKKYLESFTLENRPDPNQWYAKAFIGGVRGEDGKATTETQKLSIQFCTDFMYDITDNTNLLITDPVRNGDTNPWGKKKFPMPMETPWVNVQFYYNNDLTTVNPRYTTPEFHFQPLGSLLCVQVHNQSNREYNPQHFDFSPMSTYSGGDTSGAKQVYINNIVRFIDTNDITEEGKQRAMPGATTKYKYDGRLHYHFAPNRTAYTQAKQDRKILPNTSRYYLIWLIRNPNSTAEYYETILILHSKPKGDPGVLTDLDESKDEVLHLRTKDNPLRIHKDQYQAGKFYFAKTRIVQ